MVSNKALNITPSITIDISSKIKQLNENNIDIINLSIGEPNFNVPKKAIDYGIKSLNENKTSYDLVGGLKELRTEIKKKLQLENNIIVNEDNIIVSSGAKHAITNAFMALINPNDEVLIPKPYWVTYPETIKLLGGIPKFLETYKENSFKITKEILKNNISKNTKALILCNPSNPTGAIYNKNELKEILDFCYLNNIYIISDEIYESIDFSNNFISLASIDKKAMDIVITINGFSKSFAMTGLRIGYSISNKEISSYISKIQGHLVSHPSLTSQYIALGALKYCKEDNKNMVLEYKKRRDLAIKILKDYDLFEYIKPQGAFYIFINISKLKKYIKFDDSFSKVFCNHILDKLKIGIVPGIAFGNDDYIRISLASNPIDLKNGLEKIHKYCKEIISNK